MGGTRPQWEEGDGDDAEVISMSLGSDSGDESLRDALDFAYGHGTLPVVAAGNDGNPPGKGDNVDYPARYDSVIGVAATKKDDERPRWSSSGPDVELAAPGVDIYSTYWDDSYNTLSGTSMACPHVSGTAALVFNSPVTEGYDLDGDAAWGPMKFARRWMTLRSIWDQTEETTSTVMDWCMQETRLVNRRDTTWRLPHWRLPIGWCRGIQPQSTSQ